MDRCDIASVFLQKNVKYSKLRHLIAKRNLWCCRGCFFLRIFTNFGVHQIFEVVGIFKTVSPF